MDLVNSFTQLLGITESEIDNLPLIKGSFSKFDQKIELDANLEMIGYHLIGTNSFIEIFIDHDANSTSSAMKLNRFNIDSLYNDLAQYKIHGIQPEHSDGFYIQDSRLEKLLVEKVNSPSAPLSIMISLL